MSRFFIDRPVFAWVIAIVIMLAGALSILRLPIEQYPHIVPPSVSIKATYPGADAKTIEDSVTQVIEQRLIGIDHLRYFESESVSGSMTITLTFEPEADPDIAQVQTQNKLQTAMTLLPPEVQRQGVTVTKAHESFLLVAGFYSEDGSVNERDLGDLLTSKVQDAVARVNGVGNVTVFGEKHAMRIWLNPRKLLSYNLTTLEVRNAIEAQNTDVSAGELGGLPAAENQQLNAPIIAQTRLKTIEEFKRIILKVNPDGSQVRLKDIARVELGSENYVRIVRYKQKPAAGIAVSLASGANALETANAVKAKIASLSKFLPSSVKVVYPYDTTPFVKLSIKNVVKTLIEAIVFVFIIMFLFLQNFRATLIPSIAVPVVLLGTFAVLAAFGFTINVLTMFAMVLAIGLLVDDAIVVVENVERIMDEEGLSPKDAAYKSMEQITGALVGIAMVLSAVFVPMAFFSGSAGAIYRQFSITIVSAMALSVLVALVLSPSLCATFLKPVQKGHGAVKTGFFGWINRNLNRGRNFYQKGSAYMARRLKRFLIVYAILVVGLVYLFMQLPTAFLPDEDQGTMYLMLNAPVGATAERTLESVKKAESYMLEKEGSNVDHLFTVVGFSFAGIAQSAAIGFVGLKDWDERTNPNQSVFAITGRTMGALSQIKDAIAFAFFPPPIRELGRSSGFDFLLVDRGNLGHEALVSARNQLLGMAAKNPKLVGVRPDGLDDIPQYKIDIDTEKASAMGLSLSEINQTLQTAWGSIYVNDFLDEGRIKRVYMQADKSYRMLPDDVNEWYLRNNNQKMVPFSAFSKAHWIYGSPKLERFNGYSSVNVKGAPAPGVSTGDAMNEIQKIVSKLPKGLELEWLGVSYEERLSGSQTPALYTLSIIVVFLCLAALYESWPVPFAVILTVPLGIIGTVAATLMAGLSNDVYFQVALLTTVGLSAKNAILIVEFAKDLYEKGHNLMEATIIAVKQRFRPILMTSMAFVLGVTPLAIATGAGSASENAIGIGVMGGMIAATTLAIFFVPMFYVAVQRFSGKERKSNEKYILEGFDRDNAHDHIASDKMSNLNYQG
ncbi:MAG: efflux RND transporter permease subunit [Candidatus Nitrosoglobus sp.]